MGKKTGTCIGATILAAVVLTAALWGLQPRYNVGELTRDHVDLQAVRYLLLRSEGPSGPVEVCLDYAAMADEFTAFMDSVTLRRSPLPRGTVYSREPFTYFEAYLLRALPMEPESPLDSACSFDIQLSSTRRFWGGPSLGLDPGRSYIVTSPTGAQPLMDLLLSGAAPPP